MSIAAGMLRHRVELQRPVTTKNSAGEIESDWETVDTVWAGIEPLSAREFIAAQQMNSAVSVRVTIRYRADVTAAMRLVRGATVYNIQGVLADKESGIEYLTLPCSTGINDG